MKRIILTIAVVLITGTAAAAKPGTEQPPSSNEYVYVGPSDVALPGSLPFTELVQACRDTYGEDARLANTKELVAAVPAPLSPDEAIWVAMTDPRDGGSTDAVIGDVGGQASACIYRNVNNGLAFLTETQGFAVFGCGTTLRIACSMPQ